MTAKTENRALTAIRGMAAVWVVLHHMVPLFWPAAPRGLAAVMEIGHAGVDLFFILSGFIIAQVYRDLRPREAASFWLRRLFRVYPLQFAVMLPLTAYHIHLFLRHVPSYPWRLYPASLFMVQAFFLPVPGWNAPTWSVGVELVCYALFPLAILALRRLRPAEVTILVLIGAAAEWYVLGRFAGWIGGTGALARGLVGFGLGAAMARLPWRPAQWQAAGLELAGIAVIGAGIALQDARPIGIGSALLILALSADCGPVARLLSRPFPFWLGTVSFSIYVLHAPLMGFSNYIPASVPPLGRIAVTFALLLPLSAATYRLVEQPGRHLARLLERRWTQPARARAPTLPESVAPGD